MLLKKVAIVAYSQFGFYLDLYVANRQTITSLNHEKLIGSQS